MRIKNIHTFLTSAQAPKFIATKKALGVPELFEKMLLKLDMEKLFIVQRVSKDWQAQIKDSINLQRKMLLAYDDPKDDGREHGLHYLLDPKSAALRLHPALPCDEYRNNEHNINHIKDKESKLHLSMSIEEYNPDPCGKDWENYGDYGCACVNPGENGLDEDDRDEVSLIQNGLSRTTFTYPHSTWRSMKLTSHPRIVSASLSITLATDERDYRVAALFDKGEGTVGDAFDFLKTMIQRDEDKHDAVMRESAKTTRIIEDGLSEWEESKDRDDAQVKALIKLRNQHSGLQDCGKSKGLCCFCTSVDAWTDEEDWARFVAETLH